MPIDATIYREWTIFLLTGNSSIKLALNKLQRVFIYIYIF